ncbi:hypothetical protein Ahy_A09g046597 isoform A [Arachis hypogaea]|uniref:Uncharacterized protein n=1 Tax=Arachis hypogaea TaxID=3818 RepID=A0A445BQ87_ARAHY|nr:hypothetical protein Ahy_A09g046597 isoform A [Arachis hypogaea]
MPQPEGEQARATQESEELRGTPRAKEKGEPEEGEAGSIGGARCQEVLRSDAGRVQEASPWVEAVSPVKNESRQRLLLSITLLSFSSPSRCRLFLSVTPLPPPLRYVVVVLFSVTHPPSSFSVPVTCDSDCFNNGGVYGGGRRNPKGMNGRHKHNFVPTSFVPSAREHALIEAFGGKFYLIGTQSFLAR